MLKFLYRIGIKTYNFCLFLLSPCYPKARLLYRGRRALWASLEKFSRQNQQPLIWFHCASLGEFEQGRPLIERCKTDFPNYALALTFFSPSGYEQHKNYAYAAFVGYLPSDSASNARRFLGLLRPKVAVFVKYEFWHYYLAEMKRQKILALCVSALFRPESHIFGRSGAFFRRIIGNFAHIFVQNQESEQLLRQHGIAQVSISGDTRADRVCQIAKHTEGIEAAEKFKGEVFTFVIGSSWPADLSIMTDFLDHFSAPLKIIIAPHEIGAQKLAAVENAFTRKKVVRFTNFRTDAQADVLLIDNIGMLAQLYRYADLAYVGGAFGKGLHNILEPAVYGTAVIFGANYRKFEEASALIAQKAAFSVRNRREFEAVFLRLYHSPKHCAAAGKRAKAYVEAQAGASQKIMTYLKQKLHTQQIE